ncbi:MAG TPA: RT0821/Lpp0805 family surface protein [Alphaproteobacteria bacterium]|nr:RT0821/Lpp0805 family surface protein [Alphaproteobacteria bacterium]
MRVLSTNFSRRLSGTVAAAILTVFIASLMPLSAAYADPPPWAPAHGWRAKQHHKKDRYVHYAAAPFDIDLGHCNRDVLGAVIGGVAGGAIGAGVAKGDNRTVAIVGGTIIGAIIGGVIGRSMDRVDQNCVGQALEHAQDGQEVRWHAPNGYEYEVVPRRTYTSAGGQYCREYTTTAVIHGRAERVYGTACRTPDGSWRLVS